MSDEMDELEGEEYPLDEDESENCAALITTPRPKRARYHHDTNTSVNLPVKTSDVPAECPRINIPFPQVLLMAEEAHQKSLPNPKFMKRMRITNEKCSLTSFVVHKVNHHVEKSSPAVKDRETVYDEHVCEQCNERKVLDNRTAQSVCLKCGESSTYMVPDLSFREGVSVHTPYLYKMSNHFRDHLKRVQGKESTVIPEGVLERIRGELGKRVYGSEDLLSVTPLDIRCILKRLNLSNLYNHTIRIWALTTGNKPPNMTLIQEQELLHMFNLIQGPWKRHKPPDRSNMLSYSYLIIKMATLLKYHDLAAHFRLLKSKEKIIFQDMVWSKICAELGLPFQRST